LGRQAADAEKGAALEPELRPQLVALRSLPRDALLEEREVDGVRRDRDSVARRTERDEVVRGGSPRDDEARCRPQHDPLRQLERRRAAPLVSRRRLDPDDERAARGPRPRRSFPERRLVPSADEDEVGLETAKPEEGAGVCDDPTAPRGEIAARKDLESEGR